MNASRKLYERNNTFSKRPGLPQVASYVVFALEVVLFYAVVLPALTSGPQIALGFLYTATLLLLIAATVVASKVDPSDQVMILYRNHPREEYLKWHAGSNNSAARTLPSCSSATTAAATCATSPATARPATAAFRTSTTTACGLTTASENSTTALSLS